MSVRKILLLGNQKLYNTSVQVKRDELPDISQVLLDLQDTLFDYREKYGAGRAIAAPQIDIFKKVIFMYINEPVVFINPEIEFIDDEEYEVWDDCMSFPGLKVKVLRHKKCRIKYRNLLWNDCVSELTDDLSELLQHEYDHLNGILAVQRAVDSQSFIMDKN